MIERKSSRRRINIRISLGRARTIVIGSLSGGTSKEARARSHRHREETAVPTNRPTDRPTDRKTKRRRGSKTNASSTWEKKMRPPKLLRHTRILAVPCLMVLTYHVPAVRFPSPRTDLSDGEIRSFHVISPPHDLPVIASLHRDLLTA